MKKNRLFKTATIMLFLVSGAFVGVNAQVTIGNNKSPELFSVLELISNNTRGLRLPHLSNDERNAITTDDFKLNPLAQGLTIFNTDTKCVEVWNGTVWISWCGEQLPLPEIQWKDIPYVGAFWKANQVGERCIYAGHTGKWSAAVLDESGAGAFVKLDAFTGPTDPNYKTDNPGDAENYPVTNGTATVSGSGNIAFRIGLTGTLQSALTAPRYAIIEVKWTNAAELDMTSYIYVRQGEAEDFAPGQSSGAKWSVYNLGNANNFMAFPTQAGYFYQWCNAPTPYHPVGNPPNATPAGWPFTPPNNYFDTGAFNLGGCPSGYVVPSGDGGDMTILMSCSSTTGYYADGFFDRRQIVPSVTYGSIDNSHLNSVLPPPYDKTAVSSNSSNYSDPANANVAYIGTLFFSNTNNSSLFFPAAGFRFGGDATFAPGNSAPGELWSAGRDGRYWSRDEYDDWGGGDNSAYSFGTDIMWKLIDNTWSAPAVGKSQRSDGNSVRCVK